MESAHVDSTQPFATLLVNGPDAQRFLQSLTCNDVTSLTTDARQWNGLCTPKGRLLAIFWLERVEETTFRILIDPESAPFLQSTLLKYRFRSKVTIDLGAETSGLTWATFVAEGWPWILPPNREMFLPQWVNLDLIGGVSFKKGCYPGQEIIARTRYLGEVKRRMVKVVGAGDPPAAGTPCFSAAMGEQTVGRVVLSVPHPDGYAALVSVPKSVIPEGTVAIGAPDGAKATLTPLPYALDEVKG